MINSIKDTMTLYNGIKIPGFGFGVWQIPQDATAQCVKEAIKAG